MFIILAIGADDIFVICDTWSQYRTAAPDAPMANRMTATLQHAGKVMASTSASTCFSFIGNATSAFPAVYTFGAFAAWLVFVNYCAVCLFYPTVLAVHETYFHTKNLKKGCCVAQKCSETECATSCCCGKFDNTADEEPGERAIDQFFQYRYYPWIVKWRKNLLMASFLFFLIFSFLATQLEPDPETPQIYPNGNNYQEYSDAVSDNFASSTDTQQVIHISWGINGIDRDGTDPTDSEDTGTVIYSDNIPRFAFSTDEQQYIAQLCDDLLCLHGDYICRYTEETYYDLLISDPANYNDEDVNVLKCPILHFREWVEDDSAAQPDNATIQETLEDYNLTANFGLELTDFDDCEWGVFPVEGD